MSISEHQKADEAMFYIINIFLNKKIKLFNPQKKKHLHHIW